MTTRSRFSAARMMRCDAGGGHRERLLHQDVEIGRERGENVRLVQMVRRADHDRVERLGVRSTSSMSSSASLTPNRSASARALGRSVSQMACTSIDLELLEHRQVRHLGDRPAADDADPESLARGPAGGHAGSSLSRGARAPRPGSTRRGCARNPARRGSGRRRPTGRSRRRGPRPAPSAASRVTRRPAPVTVSVNVLLRSSSPDARPEHLADAGPVHVARRPAERRSSSCPTRPDGGAVASPARRALRSRRPPAAESPAASAGRVRCSVARSASPVHSSCQRKRGEMLQ